ncbi:hypothetical protein Scep_004848 [Stephania cephalantha]|uniref:Cytochrome B561-related protein n=1 Tax=Stephania cephalantha TaxID=152367 RepID=A0AAP0PXN5_9MAGN
MLNGSRGSQETNQRPLKPAKFSVYQNPNFSAALTANSLSPSKSTYLCIFSVSAASAFALLAILSREDAFVNNLGFGLVSGATAHLLARIAQIVVGLVFIGTLIVLLGALSLLRGRNAGVVSSLSSSKIAKERRNLTDRQLGLMGIKSKSADAVDSCSAKKPPKSKRQSFSSPSDVLVPLHQSVISPNHAYRIGSDKPITSNGSKVGSFHVISKSPGSPSSPYLVTSPSSQGSSIRTSPGLAKAVSTPWFKQQALVAGKDITTEEMLEQFLAEVDKKMSESATKVATPQATVGGIGIVSPGTSASSANASGATRSTPLRPVRMSPVSQKFNTPPKKGEGELPSPMLMEEAIEAFENLEVYPRIEQWRDGLRQWFSSVVLNPLLDKIETSHLQVMQSASKLGISITVNQVGNNLSTVSVPATVSSVDGTKEWQLSFIQDEDGLLHQLRATLLQALDASLSKPPLSNIQQSPQQNTLAPVIQECIDAITEHQRLHTLMKGEWVKGILPQSSVRADYTVQRIQELAEGTCLKNYEYLGNGEVYDKVNKKWTLELPTDSHLLLYLFCAFLEHPKWMLHVDPTSYASAQSSKNPLFLGVLPPKERFPEKYLAVISGVPSVLHPGACVLVVGKQSPPLFALYWDKKLQFSLQGRTALWDAILLLCHRIKVVYGGVVRGMHLGSSAYSILSIIDSESED